MYIRSAEPEPGAGIMDLLRMTDHNGASAVVQAPATTVTVDCNRSRVKLRSGSRYCFGVQGLLNIRLWLRNIGGEERNGCFISRRTKVLTHERCVKGKFPFHLIFLAHVHTPSGRVHPAYESQAPGCNSVNLPIIMPSSRYRTQTIHRAPRP